MDNKVIRECNHCGFQYDQKNWRFTYLGDDIWRCSICGSKYTHIVEIINPIDKKGT